MPLQLTPNDIVLGRRLPGLADRVAGLLAAVGIAALAADEGIIRQGRRQAGAGQQGGKERELGPSGAAGLLALAHRVPCVG